MGKKVQVKPDFWSVLLPDGQPHSMGALVDLTDAEYAGLEEATLRALTLIGDVDDPVRPTPSTPPSGAFVEPKVEVYQVTLDIDSTTGVCMPSAVAAVFSGDPFEGQEGYTTRSLELEPDGRYLLLPEGWWQIAYQAALTFDPETVPAWVTLSETGTWDYSPTKVTQTPHDAAAALHGQTGITRSDGTVDAANVRVHFEPGTNVAMDGQTCLVVVQVSRFA